jgi:hypothetical protein
MTRLEIALQRLHNQRIAGAVCEKPADVVGCMGAVQAQDYAGVKWAIALRMQSTTDDDIEQAIADTTIIRTWALRGTLHIVAAADIRWILSLATPRIIGSNALRYRQLELDDATLAAAESVLVRTLRDGTQLIRKESAAALEHAGISTVGQRLVFILQRASLDRLICFGVRRGKEFSYTLLDLWAPPTRDGGRDHSLAELAERYFMSHGPATLQDYVWWSGLAAADARIGLDMVKGKLAQDVIDGENYWQAQHSPSPQRSPPPACLLPCFDEFIVGYRDREAILDAWDRVQSGNGLLHPTIAIGGRIAGTWKRTFKKDAVLIAARPFAVLSKAQARRVSAAAQRYGEFLKMPVVLS